MYAKDLYEAKYQLLNNKRKSVGLEYIEEYNIDKGRKMLIVFDDMIADIINNKKLNSIVTELFIRGRELDISLAFIT